MTQLILPLETKNLLDFEHFYPAENELSVASLRHWPESEWFIFLQGPEGSGKTHLAEALAGQMLAQGQKVLYLSARHPAFYDSLTHLGFADVLVIDDFDSLFPATPDQEQQLFSFYNQCFEKKSPRLLLLSRIKAMELNISLKDLASRLQNGLPLYLKPVRDEHLIEILHSHAQRLALHLNEDVYQYLLHHLQRASKILVSSLEKLAESSLKDKRRLTLNYIKKIL
ncbi:MAG: DnaA/Hda family protein [Gammaproteobacteria bacterium]|nr:DnaA/Hda family protein [Gammaproteobacteria bacterium]